MKAVGTGAHKIQNYGIGLILPDLIFYKHEMILMFLADMVIVKVSNQKFVNLLN